ncbi:ion transporter [Parendozoicomonas haliclonae]|uniref:Ion transport protein n=1 Tax=Parendozoicomonas haliclonae TaxID=1960125 RepID=A0A1X7AFE4_9GAMM|nr:ion transporter [Parendozoicomonas haliclonae]SMA35623.1 Ion transport protein [Parendozoicomonas haliclonae]
MIKAGTEGAAVKPWQQAIQGIVDSGWFNNLIIGLIIVNGLVIGLETDPGIVAAFGDWFVLLNQIVVGAFVIEAVLKMTAVAPRLGRYFGNGWNCFDFTVTVLSLIPAVGPLATLARLARLLRVLRLVSAFPELRLIVSTLIRSIPGMGHVVMLMMVIFYIYAVAGFHLFSEVDPTHWNSLGISLLTLFRIVTLEDWTDVMYASMEVYPWAWVYYVSFVVCGTFVVINLFIAVVLNNLDEAKAEKLQDLTREPTRSEILQELKATQDSLIRLQKQLENAERNRSAS